GRVRLSGLGGGRPACGPFGEGSGHPLRRRRRGASGSRPGGRKATGKAGRSAARRARLDSATCPVMDHFFRKRGIRKEENRIPIRKRELTVVEGGCAAGARPSTERHNPLRPN